MSEPAILLPDVPRPLRRFHVTVTMRRDGDDSLVPPEGQAAAELAAAAVCAEGLVTAWMYAQTVLVMTVELDSAVDALGAGFAVARALGCERGAWVAAELVTAGIAVGRLDLQA